MKEESVEKLSFEALPKKKDQITQATISADAPSSS